MSEKVVWSSKGTENYFYNLNDEEKKNYLIDRGYDPEMLANADLDQVVADDDYMWQDDSEDFEYNVAPMIAKQTKDGVVIMFGEGARWDGTRQLGKAVDANDLNSGDLDPDVTAIEIVDDGDGLVWLGSHHDGTHHMNLYALPEDEARLRDFAKECLQDYIDNSIADEIDWEYDSEEEEIDHNVLDSVLVDLDSDPIRLINSYCDFEKVPTVCDRIKNLLTESLDEEKIDEVKAKDPKGLRKEYNEIRDLADEYGREYFTSMPFTAYDDDPESIEMKYPNFFRVVKSFFKEMGILEGEELDDSDALDTEWDQDINQHDWETLMKTCDLITTKNKKKGTYDPYQFEKIYKDNYSDGLDDEKILADREKEDQEFEDESLEEAEGDTLVGYDVEALDENNDWYSINPLEDDGQHMFTNEEDAIAYADTNEEAKRVIKVEYEDDGNGQHFIVKELGQVWPDIHDTYDNGKYIEPEDPEDSNFMPVEDESLEEDDEFGPDAGPWGPFKK